MKKLLQNIFIYTVLMLAIANTAVAQLGYQEVSGYVRDETTKAGIAYASVTIIGTGIGTVTNSEGGFLIKFDASHSGGILAVSHLGYHSQQFALRRLSPENNILTLKPGTVLLKETIIRPNDARAMVEEALGKVRYNYTDEPYMLKGFYRESIRQRREYISLSEAVVDIYKTAYTSIADDQVRIYKGRKAENLYKADTLMVHLQGGPYVSLLLDVVKHTDLSISLNDLNNYKFAFDEVVDIDGGSYTVIKFSPDVVKEEPLYEGKLYIDNSTKGIARAEFSLDISDPAKAAGMFIRKKPKGLIFQPTLTNYLVTYKSMDGKLMLNYVRAELKFKCDWKRRLFRNNYLVISELAVTNRQNVAASRFASQEQFKAGMVFSDKVSNFSDAVFWGPENIIQPDETIENAVQRITRTIQKHEKK